MIPALVLLLLAVAGCAGGPFTSEDPRPSLEATVATIIGSPPVDQVHWGILAVDAVTGDTILQRSARLKFVPASNAKILVTAAALLEMGPDHRFSTELWAAGPVDDQGILEGDLVIPGDGDPTLSRRYWDDDEAPLRAMADSVRRAGLTEVQGRLVLDLSAWDSVPTPGSWMVGNLPWGFSAVGAPFAIAEGTTRVVVEGGDPGSAAAYSWLPGGTPDFIRGEVLTVAAEDSLAEVSSSWDASAGRHVLWGSIREGQVDTIPLSTRLPAREAGIRLLQLLDSSGVRVRDGLEVVVDTGRALAVGCTSGRVPSCTGAARVAALASPPLADIARGILEPSQNWMTEQVVRSLAVHRGERGSWPRGVAAVSDVLRREAGVDSLDIDLRDGSGLSAYNLVTPRAVVAVLMRMRVSEMAEAYRQALAAPGEVDSTLERRLLDLEGRVQAKTGTISNVNSLSGYLQADSGREVVFAILTNGSGLPSGVVRDRMDEVVRALARYR